MTLSRVEIESTGPTTSRIKVNGADMSNYLVGYSIRGRTGELPQLTLDLLSAEIVRVDADVVLPAWLTEALTALGWTPPGAGQLVGEPQTPAEVSSGSFRLEISAWIAEILDRQTAWLESLIRQLTIGESLCVHEHDREEMRRALTAHALASGARCHVSTPSRKTQYGPVTAEILAALGEG
jgi:hypothetical protein